MLRISLRSLDWILGCRASSRTAQLKLFAVAAIQALSSAPETEVKISSPTFMTRHYYRPHLRQKLILVELRLFIFRRICFYWRKHQLSQRQGI